MTGRLRRRAAGLLCVLLWSTCFVAVRGTEGAAPPLLYAGVRAAIAAAVLFALAARAGALRPPAGTLPWLLVLGVAGTTVALAGMFESVGLAGAAIPAVVAESQALLVAPFAAWFFGEALGPTRILGLLLGIAGVVVITAADLPGGGSGSGRGILLALASAAGLAGATLVMKRLAGRVWALTAVAWQYGAGAAGLFLLSLMFEGSPRIELSLRLGLGLAWLGVALSAGATWLWFRLVESGDLVALNSLTLLTPVFAVGWALLIFAERPGALALAGIVVALAGVALVAAPRRRREPSDAEGRSRDGTIAPR